MLHIGECSLAANAAGEHSPTVLDLQQGGIEARQGLLDFTLSALTEKDLKAGAPPKIEYHFIKKAPGFSKEVNTLAAQGFRFITGRRIGLIRMALMAKQANENEATTYTFIDEKKYAKEFDKTVALGNSYRGVIVGDLTCGSEGAENEDLVFAQNAGGKKHEYKIHNLLMTTAGDPTAESLLEFHRLVGENFQVKNQMRSTNLGLSGARSLEQ